MTEQPTILGDPEEIRETVARPTPAGRADLTAAAATDEHKRQAAFDAVPHWQGSPLKPFSISRETLFLQLRHAAGAPGLYSAMLDGEAWFGDAVRILWLCLHGPDDWDSLRGQPLDLQRAIDAWADETIPRGSKADIVLLTIRLWNESQVNAHEPVPGDAAEGRQEPGN
jgi:hypothetical protein